jgi:hypothetical protein
MRLTYSVSSVSHIPCEPQKEGESRHERYRQYRDGRAKEIVKDAQWEHDVQIGTDLAECLAMPCSE